MKRSCLFLDRDGVINRKLPDAYVRTPDEFEFLPGVPEAIAGLRDHFEFIVVVTNQQGISKGIMSTSDLSKVHEHMTHLLEASGARLDGIYYCSDLAGPDALCRKPNIGMVLQAIQEIPAISLPDSAIAGDSPADLILGYRCGMRTVRIDSHDHYAESSFEELAIDETHPSLLAFYQSLKSSLSPGII